MSKLVRTLGISLAVVASGLSAAGVASAAVTVPFQIDPAPFGNPNGSFDVPPIRCVAVVGDQPGTAVITGGKGDGWGCLLYSPVHWVNLSTGATGSARLSDGLNGIPPHVTLNTGPGQIALVLDPMGGSTTPGFATFLVP